MNAPMSMNAVQTPRSRRRRGLSLAEILIAGAIVALLLISIAAAYDAMAQSVEVNDRFNRCAQIARIGVRRMVEEVRTAEAVQVGSVDQQSQTSIVDAPNLDIIQPSGRVVHYVYDADLHQVLYRIDHPTDPIEVVLARDVANATFTADIEPHPDTGVRRTVRVVIELTMDVEGQTLYLCGSAVPRREMVY